MAIEKNKNSGKFEAPNIHTGASAPTKKYYFENRLQPGSPLDFFAGNAKVAECGDREGDVKQYHLEHGTEVELTEEMARHIRGKGTVKPIMEEDGFGMRDSGRTYTDRRFDLHEV